MNRTALTSLTAAAALAATTTGAVLLTAGPAAADTERSVRCGGAVATLSVDREDGALEVDADVDRAAPGSRWRVVLRHEGRVVADRVLRADREGELDLDRVRPDTAGTDTLRLTVDRRGPAAPCSVVAVLR